MGAPDSASPRAALVSGADLDPLFGATVEATEAAVLNALWQAERTVGRDGVTAERLPHEELLELLSAHGQRAARPE